MRSDRLSSLSPAVSFPPSPTDSLGDDGLADSLGDHAITAEGGDAFPFYQNFQSGIQDVSVSVRSPSVPTRVNDLECDDGFAAPRSAATRPRRRRGLRELSAELLRRPGWQALGTFLLRLAPQAPCPTNRLPVS